MTIQFLITHYKETENILSHILNSIEMQQGINLKDIGVIIASDGAEKPISQSFIESWPFNIKYIKCEHRGISATRNELLRAATADYVMLCDADDIFSDVLAFYTILNNIKLMSTVDMFSYTFIEELKNKGQFFYRTRRNDIFCIHGKVFKRKWLVENDLWYEDSQVCFGDTYFVGLASRIAINKKYIDKPIYMWKYNSNSISRTNNFFITRFDMKLKADGFLIDALLQRGNLGAREALLLMLYESYYMMTVDKWKEQDNNNRLAAERILRDNLNHFSTLLKQCNAVEHANVNGVVCNNYIKNGAPMPNMTFNDWLKYIKEGEYESMDK